MALADTNCDPDEMDYPIPANDDAIRAVRLLCAKIADAAVEGRRQLEALQKDNEEVEKEEREEPVAAESLLPAPEAEVAAPPETAEPAEVPAEEASTPAEPELVTKEAH